MHFTPKKAKKDPFMSDSVLINFANLLPIPAKWQTKLDKKLSHEATVSDISFVSILRLLLSGFPKSLLLGHPHFLSQLSNVFTQHRRSS